MGNLMSKAAFCCKFKAPILGNGAMFHPDGSVHFFVLHNVTFVSFVTKVTRNYEKNKPIWFLHKNGLQGCGPFVLQELSSLSFFDQSLIHLKQLSHNLRLRHILTEAVGLHYGGVVGTMGLAELNGHREVVVKVSEAAVWI